MAIATARRRDEVDRWIPATLEAIDQVCAEVKKFLADRQLDRLGFEVVLLVREALINAVVHGARLDPANRIRFILTQEGGHVVVTVEDPGPGFDWRQEVDGAVDPSREHGRGLLIFHRYATDFAYNDKGNRLTLRKAVTG